MQTITHQNLYLEGMVRIHTITNVQMGVTKNEHAKLFVCGIAMEDEKTSLFSGLVEQINLVYEQGLYYFEVEVISATILFDRKKRKRSFQNVGMTYEEVALQVPFILNIPTVCLGYGLDFQGK